MIFRNYKRPNPFKEVIDNFTDTNLHFSFGAVRNSCSARYKWIADYLFKNKNNTNTNKHRMFVGFFSNKEMVLSEYGNIAELQEDQYMSIYFDGIAKTKLPEFIYELSSGRYKKIGQEYAEYDEIEYTDPSERLYSNDNLYGHEDNFVSDSGTAVYGTFYFTGAVNQYPFLDSRIKHGTKIKIDGLTYTIDNKSTDGSVIWLQEPIQASGSVDWSFDIYDIVLGDRRRITEEINGVGFATSGLYYLDSIYNDFSSDYIQPGKIIYIGGLPYTIDLKISSERLKLLEPLAPSGQVSWRFFKIDIFRQVIDVNHRFGDSPVFISAGYKFNDWTTGRNRYFWDNPPDWVEINYDNFKIILNDDEKDLYTHSYFLEKINSQTPLSSGAILVDVVGEGLLVSTPIQYNSGTNDPIPVR